VDELGQADAFVTTKGFFRKRPRLITDAERKGIPVYVLRANTVAQMEACLSDIAAENHLPGPLTPALREADHAIRRILDGEADEVELSPQNAFIRRQQHEMAREAGLSSYSVGEEPNRRVRITRA
jgi:hypothetical protein